MLWARIITIRLLYTYIEQRAQNTINDRLLLSSLSLSFFVFHCPLSASSLFSGDLRTTCDQDAATVLIAEKLVQWAAPRQQEAAEDEKN